MSRRGSTEVFFIVVAIITTIVAITSLYLQFRTPKPVAMDDFEFHSEHLANHELCRQYGTGALPENAVTTLKLDLLCAERNYTKGVGDCFGSELNLLCSRVRT